MPSCVQVSRKCVCTESWCTERRNAEPRAARARRESTVMAPSAPIISAVMPRRTSAAAISVASSRLNSNSARPRALVAPGFSAKWPTSIATFGAAPIATGARASTRSGSRRTRAIVADNAFFTKGMRMRFQGSDTYVTTDDLTLAVNAAITLERPLLVKGEPGTGKTRLAIEVSNSLGLPLLEWHIKSTTKAQQGLYEYDAVSR